jgi:hypothetical protein
MERGTGRAAALDGFVAGKTGTSQEHRDAWFIGFTDSLVVAGAPPFPVRSRVVSAPCLIHAKLLVESAASGTT